MYVQYKQNYKVRRLDYGKDNHPQITRNEGQGREN